jgi:hypothetical protein
MSHMSVKMSSLSYDIHLLFYLLLERLAGQGLVDAGSHLHQRRYP